MTQRPSFKARIASTLPVKRISKCKCGSANSRNCPRASSWLAYRVTTWLASSKATAKERSSSARKASICGANRACAWRSAHISLLPNSLKRADWPFSQISNSSPSSVSQRFSSPQTWRYESPSCRAPAEIDPWVETASSKSIKGLRTVAGLASLLSV